MPDSGQRTRAENVAAPGLTLAQGHATEITVETPLPKGWAAFCSRVRPDEAAWWYATPPWDVLALQDEHGALAAKLVPTVDAPTWKELHAVVAEQASIHAGIKSGAAA